MVAEAQMTGRVSSAEISSRRMHGPGPYFLSQSGRFLLMLGLVISIALAAIWAARNARETFYSAYISGNGQAALFLNLRADGKFQDAQVASINLVNEQSYKIPDLINVLNMGIDGNQFWILREVETGQYQLCMRTLPALELTYVREFASLPEDLIVMDGVAFYTKSNSLLSQLESLDLVSGQLVDQIDLKLRPPIRAARLPGSTNVLVFETRRAFQVLNSDAMLENCLIRHVQGKLSEAARWFANNVDFAESNEDTSSCIVSHTLSGAMLEVRDPVDGKVKCSFEIPQMTYGTMAQNVFRPSFEIGPSYITYSDRSIDAYSKKTLPVPAGSTIVHRDPQRSRMLVSPARSDTIIAIDELSGVESARWNIASNAIGRRVVRDGRQFAVATRDMRVHFFDITTGKLSKSVDAFRWMIWVDWLVASLFTLWSIDWLKLSSQTHAHARIDIGLCSSLVVAWVAMRAHHVGRVEDVGRPIYQIAEGVFASWLILASVWLILGKQRWSLRILPPMLLYGISVGIVTAVMGYQNPRRLASVGSGIWELIIGSGQVILCVAVACWIVRFYGYRFRRIDQLGAENDKEIHGNVRTVPMLDLLLLMTVLATIFAIARWTPPISTIKLRTVLELFALACGIAVVGMVALWSALSERWFLVRWTVLIVVIGMMTLLAFCGPNVASGWSAFSKPNWQFIGWMFRFSLATGASTLFSFYAYRLRGWRLVKAGRLA